MDKEDITPIGGYFGLELPEKKVSDFHSECRYMNSGRNALRLILELKTNKGKGDFLQKIYLPYYTCEAVLQPIKELHLNFEFYHISSQLKISDLPAVKDGECIILTNYFGLFDSYIKTLTEFYGPKAIIDNAQAWYCPAPADLYSFYSPRKYFGLPDGGALCGPSLNNLMLPEGISWHKTSHLLKRLDIGAEQGYDDFKCNSATLAKEKPSEISALTRALLASIDMENVKEKRRKNFSLLQDNLHKINKLELPSLSEFECPMVYPLLVEEPGLRQILLENKIFTATYWPNVFEWCSPQSTEYYLARHLIPLPVDQRYGEIEMRRIINIIRGSYPV